MLHCAQLAAEALTMRQSKHDHDPGQDGDEIVKTIRSRRGAMKTLAHVLARWSERSEHHDSSYGDECVQGGGRTMLGGSAWLGSEFVSQFAEYTEHRWRYSERPAATRGPVRHTQRPRAHLRSRQAVRSAMIESHTTAPQLASQ